MSQDEQDKQVSRDEQYRQGRDAPRTSVLEYVVAGLGLLCVVAAFGFMTFMALTRGDLPPEITLEITGITRSSGGYLVAIEARNLGDDTAAELGVEGTLERGAGTIETSETTFDYLPPDSRREGGLFFSENPRGALTLRVLGYREP